MMATQRVRMKCHQLKPLSAVALFLLGSGCGLMHPASSRDGDALLGSFNRPIAPTPPPTGPDIAGPTDGSGVYPAPAIGEGIRPPLPGTLPPTSDNPYSGRITEGSSPTAVPTSSNPRGPRNLLSRLFGSRDTEPARTPPKRSGASISLGNRFTDKTQELPPTWAQPTTPDLVQIHPADEPQLTSGSAIVPDGPAKPPTPHPVLGKEPGQVASVEEGQTMLSAYGVKWQRLERVENGEWQFTCGLGAGPSAAGYRQYSARNPDQLLAVKAVLQQVQREGE
jgi:hypothetical protein